MIGWYYKLGKQQAGPVSSEELMELAKAGTVKPDTEVWHAAMAGWEKASEISEVELSFPDIATQATEVMPDPVQSHAWPRFWARVIDVSILSLVVGFAVGFVFSRYLPSFYFKMVAIPDFAFSILLTPLVSLSIAIMMSLFGTTIGKVIVGVKVQNLSGLNRFAFHFLRELKVWVFGLALGLPLASFVSMIVQHRRLSLEGSTRYDRQFAQVTTKNSFMRCSIGFAVLLGVLSLNGYSSVMDKAADYDVLTLRDWTNPATNMPTMFARTWEVEEQEVDDGKLFYFSSVKLLAEMVFAYEPMEGEGVDPVEYGEALAEAIAEDVTVTSEWKAMSVNGFQGARATGFLKTVADTQVEITVAIVGASAWRSLVFVRGRPLKGFKLKDDLVRAMFTTARDINVPTNMPCEDENCVSYLLPDKLHVTIPARATADTVAHIYG